MIDRQGDYSLRLRLEEGKTTESFFGIGASEGKILVKTHRVKHLFEGVTLKLSLRYDLIFAENEVQKMKLNATAQIKKR